MKKTWILVADSSRARIFVTNTHNEPLVEIEALVHPQGRQHEQNLTSDLPGKQASKFNSSHHAIGKENDPKHQEAIDFAKTITRHLDEARARGEYSQLIVVAAPSFLGLLRENMAPQVAKLVTHALDKNLTRQKPDAIRHQLPEFLPSLGI